MYFQTIIFSDRIISTSSFIKQLFRTKSSRGVGTQTQLMNSKPFQLKICLPTLRKIFYKMTKKLLQLAIDGDYFQNILRLFFFVEDPTFSNFPNVDLVL